VRTGSRDANALPALRLTCEQEQFVFVGLPGITNLSIEADSNPTLHSSPGRFTGCECSQVQFPPYVKKRGTPEPRVEPGRSGLYSGFCEAPAHDTVSEYRTASAVSDDVGRIFFYYLHRLDRRT
jgi:hypothetical protein